MCLCNFATCSYYRMNIFTLNSHWIFFLRPAQANILSVGRIFFTVFCSLHLFSRIFILFPVKIPSLALRYSYVVHSDLRIPFLAYFDQKRIPSLKPKLKFFSLFCGRYNVQTIVFCFVLTMKI